MDSVIENEFIEVIKIIGYGIEAFGVVVVLIGSASATAKFLSTYKKLLEGEAYKNYRRSLARSIILGLEFLIAGDIIRTVVVSESIENVGTLALIVMIRAFLSVTLHLEVEGSWPWKSNSKEKSG